jgi:hypothetical protein
MTRFMVVLALLLVPVVASAQGRGQPSGITRGAAQPNQNKWSAKAPWGQTERSATLDAQRKDPFKLFDNVYYVGFQAVSSYLVTTSNGLVKASRWATRRSSSTSRQAIPQVRHQLSFP